MLASGNEFVGQWFHREDDGDDPRMSLAGYALLRKEMTSYPRNQKHNLRITVKRNSAVMELVSFQVHPISVTALATGFSVLNHVH
jgi:hypothetical protein